MLMRIPDVLIKMMLMMMSGGNNINDITYGVLSFFF